MHRHQGELHTDTDDVIRFDLKINPETGELYDQYEPLTTLRQFRQHDASHRIIRRAVGDSPIFGMHYTLSRKGQYTTNESHGLCKD